VGRIDCFICFVYLFFFQESIKEWNGYFSNEAGINNPRSGHPFPLLAVSFL
jgi:hypothetical protein